MEHKLQGKKAKRYRDGEYPYKVDIFDELVQNQFIHSQNSTKHLQWDRNNADKKWKIAGFKSMSTLVRYFRIC